MLLAVRYCLYMDQRFVRRALLLGIFLLLIHRANMKIEKAFKIQCAWTHIRLVIGGSDKAR